MFPVLFTVGPFTVHTYFFMAALGFVTAMGLGAYRALREGYDVEILLDVLLIVVFGGFIGARIVYVLTEWRTFTGQPLEALYLWKGGLVWYGGPLLVIPLCIAYGIRVGKPIRPGLDIAATCIPLGHMMGRLGCLGYGCCYGHPADLPWAIAFPRLAGDSLPRHPTQVYEALGLLLLCTGLEVLYRRRAASGMDGPRRGQVMVAYLASYAALRFVLEFFRGDDRGPEIVLSVSQWISIGVAVAGAAGALWIQRRAPASAPQ